MEDLLTHIQNITGTGEQSQEATQNQAPTPAAEEQQPVQEAQQQEQQAGADGVIDTGADLLTKLQYYTNNTAGNGSDTQKQAVVPEEKNQAQEAEPAVAPALGAKGNVAQAAITGNGAKAGKGNGAKADTRPYSAGTLAEVTVTSNLPKVRRQAAENATKAIVQAQKIKGSDFIFNGKFYDAGYADGYGKTPEQIANLINETNNSNMEYNQAYARILGLADALSPKGQHKTAAEHLGDMAGLPQKSKEILRQIVRGEGDYDTSDPYKSLDAKIANEAWADVEKQIAANEKAAQRELNSTPYYDTESAAGKSISAGIERNKTDMMKSVNKVIDAHKDEYLATIAAYASKYCNGNMEQAADKVRGGIIEAVKKRFVPNLGGSDFVLEGGVWDSIIGKLMRWGTNLASGVKEGEFHPNQAFDEALQKYGEKAGLWANLGKEAVSLSLDMPFMGAALKGASFVTNPFFKFGGSALAKGLPKSVKYFKEVIENAPAAGRAMQMTKAGRFIVGGVQQGLAGSIYSGADALLSQKAAGQDLDWAKAFEASKEGSASWALMSTVPYVGNYVNRVIEKGIPGIGKAATASRNVMKAFNEFGVVPAAMTAAMIGPGGDFSSPNIASSYLMSLFFAGKGMYDRGTYVGRDGREHKNIVVGASRIFTMNPMQKADFGFTKEELKSLNATSTFNLFRRIVNGEKIPSEELMPDYKAGESSSTSVGDYSKSRSEMFEKVKSICDKGIFKELYELLGNPNIPFSAKDKLCYVFTGVHTQRPTILGLRQIDNEDGTQSIYTVDCNDMPIDRFDFKEGKDGNLGGEAKNTFRRLANIVLHNQINVLEKKINGNLMGNAFTKAMQDLAASTGGRKYAAEFFEEMKRLSDKLSRGEKLTADERKAYNQMYRQVEHEMNAAMESSIISIRKQIADAYGISLADFENILGRNVYSLNDGERSMVQKYYTQLNREIGAPTSEFGGQPRETRKMIEQGGDGLNDVEVSATDNGGGSNDVVTEEPPKEPVKPVKPEQPIDTPTAEKPHVEGVQEKQETVEPKAEQSAQPTEPNVEPEQGKTGTTKQEKEEPVKPSDVGANVDDYKALTKDAEANPEDPEVQEAVNALEEQRKAALDYFNNGEKGEAPTNYDYWKQRMRLGEEVDEPTQPEQNVEPEQPKQQTPEEPKQREQPQEQNTQSSGKQPQPVQAKPDEPKVEQLKQTEEPTSEQPEQPKGIVPDVTQGGAASVQHESGGVGKPDVEAVKEKIAEIKSLDKLWKPLKDKNTEEAKSINGKLRKAKSELRSLLMKMSLAQLEELEDKEGEWEGTSLGYRSARDVFSDVLNYKQGEARIEERVEESKQIEPKKPQKKVAPMDFSYLDYGKKSGMNYAVYHEGGFVVGTNNHIIYARREDYPAELEGKRTDKKGRITGGSLSMPWREVLPEDEQTEPLEVDIDGLHRFVAGVRATDKSEYAHVGIKLPDGRILFYGGKGLDLFLRAARSSGAEVMLTGEDAGYKRDSLSFHTDDAAGMIMPSNKDAIYSSYVDNVCVYDASGGGTKGDGQDRPIAKENGTEEGEQPKQEEKKQAKSKWVDDEDAERFEELRRRLRKKLGGQLNMGLDPEAFTIGVEMSYLMLKHGARKFAQYAKQMIEALGENVRPYLKSFYNGARDLPEMAEYEKDMTPYDEVRSFDVKNFDKEGPKNIIATAEHIAKEQSAEREAKENASRQQEKPAKGSKSKEKPVSSQEQGVKPSAVSPEGEKPVKERPSKELSGDSDKFQKQAKSEQDFVGRIKGMIADAAKEGKSLTMADIKRAYEEERGRNSDLPSDYRDTDLQELVERAMTLATRDIAVESLSKNTPEAVRDGYDRIVQLYNSQPSLNSRDSSRMEHQQYSTPTPFAYLMDWFLRHGKTPHSGLEPSAGNGALTIGFPASIWHVNDIDERRLMNLRTMPYGEITNQDGTMPFEPKAYDMVATNPPFGTTTEKTFDGGKTKINSLEGLMAINALLSMKDDGRAAIIIGGNTSYRSNGAMQSKDMKLFRHLYTHYNVVDVINLNGDMYKRNGTGYDVRIILIDGRKADVPDNPEKFTYPPVRDEARAEQVRTFDELYKRIEDDIQHSLSQRLQSESPDTEHGVGGESGHRDENRPEDNRQRPVSDEQPVRGRPMGGSPQPAIRPADAEDGGRTGVGGEQAQISGVDNDDRRNELGAGGVRPGEPTKERGTSNRGGIGGDNRTGIPNNDNSNGRGLAVSEPQKQLNGNEDKAVGLGQEKVSYRPKSKSITFQSQVPAEQAEAIESNLDKIGDVDDFLTKELGYSSKDELFSHLSAEQIDGVALAINQMKAGKGFIIGDMTGIGKGRQGAALIRWAINQGKTPIYFTQKARLFTDNYRDMCDIGSKGLRPFIMSSNKEAPITEIVVDKNGEVVYDDNGKVKTRVVYGIPTKQESERVYKYVLDNGKLPPEYDYVLVTYSQVSTGTTEYVDDGKGKIKKKTKKSKGKTPQSEINGDIRRNVIEKLSANNYILLDESHTVGGQSSVGYYMQDILKNVAGVTYMSATFAKRPDNMPLYAMKTAMSESGLSQNKMIEAIQKGGVTLQEVMSKQLSQSGQMIRRERDFSGVSIDWEGVDPQTDKKQRAQFDEVSKLFNEIKDFQDTYVDPYINEVSNELAATGSYAVRTRGTSHLGVSNVPFASKMFNLVNQLLFALKVDAVADRAIAALKENQKPVISFTNTMEGFLKELPKGEQMEEAPDFSMTLMRALEGTLKYSEGDAASREEQKKMLSLSELGKEAQDKYNEIRRHILGLGAGLPIDPLDAIKMKIEDAGYKVGEISGREIEIVRDGEGKYVVQPRSGKDSKAVANAFNNGGIDVVFVNKSGSTGISLHASSKFGDTRQRIMIAAQFQMDINDEVQMRGRIDRTGQVQRGRYVYIMSSIPAEQRLQMMFKNKLKSLDANTTSSQKSKFNEMEVTDFMNKYGDKIVWDYMQEHPELEDRLGDPLKMFDTNGNVKEDNGSAKDDKVAPDSAAKILRRLPFLSVAEQESIFNDISEAYAVKMKLLDDAGENDLEITTMPLRAKTESKSMWVHGTNPGSGNSFADNTYLEKVEVDVLKKPMKAKEVKEYVERLTGGEDWLTWHASKHEEIAKYFDEKRKAVSDKMNAAMKNKAEKKRAEFIKGAIKVREKEGSGITDEEISRAAEKAVNDYISREQAKIDKRLNDISKQENRIYETFDYFKPYEAYVIPLNLTDRQGSLVMPSTGTFIGIKFNKSYSLSSSTAVFATLDGRRKVELPLNDEDSLSNIRKQSIMMSYEKRGLNMDNWDSRVPTNSRKTAYIVTGNLMQALVDTQKDNKTKGQLISYTTIDGEVKQGILMNSRFKEEDLYISVPIYTQREAIKAGDLVQSEDGEVSIGRSYNGIGGVFKLSVSKSKAKGGKYFLDKKLRGMIQSGEFETRGNKMVGWITEDKLDDVLVYLSKSLGVKVKQNTSLGTGGHSYSDDTRGYTTTGSEGAGSGHAERADVEQAVADVDKRTGGNTAVIDSSEVPADVVKKLGEGVKGYVKGGKAYVVADNCDSAAEAATVAVHESAGHINMRNYLGDKAGEFYQSVFDNVMSEADRAAWKQATKGESDTEAAEEFVADQARLAATGKPSIWSRIVGRFREFLWRHFGIHPSLKTVDYMLWKATQQARGRDHGVLYENENMVRDKARGEYTSEAQQEIADAEEIRGYTEARSEEQYAADFNNFMGERKVSNEEEVDKLADELEQLKQEKREMTQNAISGHSVYTGDDFKRKRLEIRLAEAQKKELEAENNLLDKLLGVEGDTRRRARGGAGSLYDATSKDERQPLDVSLAAADANILKAKLEAEMFAKEHPAEGMSEVEKRHYENLLAEQSIAKLRKQQIEMTPPVLEQPEMPKGAPKYPTFDRDENNPEVYEKAIEKYNQEKKEYEDKLAEYDDAMYENDEKFKEWKIEQGKIAAKITALRLGNKLDEAKEHFAQNWAKPGEREGLYESLSAITGIDLTGKGKNIKHVINDFFITRRKLLNRRNAEDERIIGEVERAVREFVGNRIKRGLQAAGRKIGGIVAPEKTRPTGASLNSVAEVNRALIDMVEGTMETPEELKPVVEKIRHYFDDVFNWLAEEGMANPYQRRKNYVPHVWDMEKSDISRDLLTKLQGMEAAEIQRRYEGMTNDEAEAQIKWLNTQLRRIKLDYDSLKARRSGYEKGMSEYNELSDQMKAEIDELNRVKRQMSELRRYIGMQNLRLMINSKLYEGDEATEAQDWLTTRSRFMQERELDSYAEGIRGGLVPKYDSITDLMRYYGGQSNQAVANRDLIDLLKNVNYVDANGGKHPLIKEIDDRPTEGYVTLPNKALHGYEVLAGPKNRYLGYLNVLFGSKRIFGSSGDWLQSIGAAVDVLNSIAKTGQLTLSGFHHIALSEGFLGMSHGHGLPWLSVSKGADGKRKIRFTAGGPIEEIYGMVIKTIATGELPSTRMPELVDDAVYHLVKLGATGDYNAKETASILQNLADKFGNMASAEWKAIVNSRNEQEYSNSVAKFIDKIGVKRLHKYLSIGALHAGRTAVSTLNSVLEVNNWILWDLVHDSVKLMAYRDRAAQIRKQAEAQGWTQKELDGVLDELGQFINDTFGGQNWETMMASKKVLRAFQFTFLSPDWNFSAMRHFSSLVGGGRLYNYDPWYRHVFEVSMLRLKKMLAGQSPFKSAHSLGADMGAVTRKSLGRTCIAASTFLLSAAYSFMQLYNRYKDEQRAAKQEDNPYKEAYGDDWKPLDLSTKEGWYDALSRGDEWIVYPWNTMNAPGRSTYLFLGRGDDGTERYMRWGKQYREIFDLLISETGAFDPFTGINKIIGKTSPVLQFVPNVLTGRSLTADDWADNKDITEADNWKDATTSRLTAMAQMFSPYSLRQKNKGFVVAQLMMPVSKGLTIGKAVPLLVKAIDSGDMRLVERVRRSVYLSGLDYKKVQDMANMQVETRRTEEMKKSIGSPEQALIEWQKAKAKGDSKGMEKYENMYKRLTDTAHTVVSEQEALEDAKRILKGDYAEGQQKLYDSLKGVEDVREDTRLSRLKSNLQVKYEQAIPFVKEIERMAEDDNVSYNTYKAYQRAHRADFISYLRYQNVKAISDRISRVKSYMKQTSEGKIEKFTKTGKLSTRYFPKDKGMAEIRRLRKMALTGQEYDAETYDSPYLNQ